jgi:hypothetical protein
MKGRGFLSRTPAGKDLANAPNMLTKDESGHAASSETAGPEDELQKLRFNRHFTAFDVNIESLPEHPWRDKNVDVSDYFNYGFTERTWLVCYIYICILLIIYVFFAFALIDCSFTDLL